MIAYYWKATAEGLSFSGEDPSGLTLLGCADQAIVKAAKEKWPDQMLGQHQEAREYLAFAHSFGDISRRHSYPIDGKKYVGHDGLSVTFDLVKTTWTDFRARFGKDPAG